MVGIRYITIIAACVAGAVLGYMSTHRNVSNHGYDVTQTINIVSACIAWYDNAEDQSQCMLDELQSAYPNANG